MDPQIKENMADTNTWGRGLFMLLFAFIHWAAKIVLVVTIVIQFGFVLFSGGKNIRLLQLSRELSSFLYQIFMFLTFNSETKPYPFHPWPSSGEGNNSETPIEKPIDSEDFDQERENKE